MGIRKIYEALQYGSIDDGIDPTVLRLGDDSPVELYPYQYQHLQCVDVNESLAEVRSIIQTPEGREALLIMAREALASIDQQPHQS